VSRRETFVSEFSILAARKKLVYRILESVLGVSSLVFLVLLLILSLGWPTVAAVFLIVYSFFWLLRVTSICLYTIYSYKNLKRWESFNLPQILSSFDQSLDQAKAELLSIQKKYSQSLDWQWHLQQILIIYPELANTKFSKPTKCTYTYFLCFIMNRLKF
jgi:hypothetical protein